MPGFLRKTVIFLAFVFCVIFAAPGAYAAEQRCCSAGYYGDGSSCSRCETGTPTDTLGYYADSDRGSIGHCKNYEAADCYRNIPAGKAWDNCIASSIGMGGNDCTQKLINCPRGYYCLGKKIYRGSAVSSYANNNYWATQCSTTGLYCGPDKYAYSVPSNCSGCIANNLYPYLYGFLFEGATQCGTNYTTSGRGATASSQCSIRYWNISIKKNDGTSNLVTTIYTVKTNGNTSSAGGDLYSDETDLYDQFTGSLSSGSTVISTAPTRTGYTYGGVYSTSSSTGGTQYINASGALTSSGYTNAAQATADKTWYARWTPKVLTVTLDSKYYATSSTGTGTGVGTNAAPSTIYLKYNTGWYGNSGATTVFSSLTTLPNYQTSYPFYGFYTGKAGTGTRVIDENGNIISGNLTVCSENCTLYAYYPQAYTVTFKTGGTTLGTQIFLSGESKALTAVSNFTQPVSSTYGWGFYGWRTKSGSTARTYTDGQSITPTANMTLYGIWRRPVVFKRFSSATATSFVSSTSYQYYYNTATSTAGVNSVAPTSLVKQTTYNWDPIGWVLNNTTSTTPTISQLAGATPVAITSAKNVVTTPYYALYKRDATLVYNGNTNTGGSTENTVGTQYLNAGQNVAITLPMTLGPNGFTKNGYSFNKWAAGSISGTQYSDGGTFNFPNTAIASSGTYNMYATWNQNCNAVTFNNTTNNSGAIPTSSVLYKLSGDTAWYDNNTCSGTPVTTLLTLPTIAYGSFYGYFLTAISQGTTILSPTTHQLSSTWQITEPKTVYAHYRCNTGYSFNSMVGLCAANTITLNWDENGGDAISNGSCTYNGDLVLPAAPTRAGYMFDGWKLANNSTQPAGSTITGGCTSTYTGVTSGTSTAIQAQWTESNYTISYTLNGGATIASGYTPVEYIRSNDSATSYIDTGYSPKSDTKTEAIVMVDNNAGNQNIYGSGYSNSDSSADLALFVFNSMSNTQYEIKFAGTVGGLWRNVTSTPLNKNVIFLSGNEFRVNDSLLSAYFNQNGVVADSGNKPFYLFQRWRSSISNTNNKVTVYGFRIYDGNTLVRNLLPVRRNSDNKCGMYDTVGGTFYGASGTFTCPATSAMPTSYTYGTGATVNFTPSRAHSIFAGWCSDSALTSCSATQTVSGTATGNKTFYAKWTCEAGYSANSGNTACNPNTITLVWNKNGHGASNPSTPASCTYGTKFTTASAITDSGYAFKNWKRGGTDIFGINDGYTTYNAGTEILCTQANLNVTSGTATFDAQWTPETYTISYELNGGTNYNGAPTSYTYGVGAVINGTPTHDYGTFAGWCTDSALQNCSSAQNISTSATGAKTFYAKWTCNTGFEGDGCHARCNAITVHIKARGGYLPGYTNVQDVVLYRHSGHIDVDAGGNAYWWTDSTCNTRTVKNFIEVTPYRTLPKKDNAGFVGVYSNNTDEYAVDNLADYVAKDGTFQDIDINSDVEAWAHFVCEPDYAENGKDIKRLCEKNYKLHLESEGADTNGTVALYTIHNVAAYLNSLRTEGQEMTQSEYPITLPTKTGYSFDGYFSNTSGTLGGTGTQYVSNTGYITDAGISAATSCSDNYSKWYAKMEPNTYTVTFKTGNITLGTQNFTYGTAQNLTTLANLSNVPSALTNASYGWEFDGWSTTPDTITRNYTNGQNVNNLTTTSGGNVTLYGIWKRNVSFTYYASASDTTNTTNTRTQYYRNTNDSIADVTSVESYPLYTNTIYGWTPLGWNHSSATTNVPYEQTGTNTIQISPSQGTTMYNYYAVYERTITLTYNGNGNTGGSAPANTTGIQIANAGAGYYGQPSMTLASNTFTKTGYTFSKWASGTTSGQQYDAGADMYFPNHTWTSSATNPMYAIWTPNRFKITFRTVPLNPNNVETYAQYGTADLYTTVGGSTLATVPLFNIPHGSFGGWNANLAPNGQTPNLVPIYTVNNGVAQLVNTTVAGYVQGGVWVTTEDRNLYPIINCDTGYSLDGDTGECVANDYRVAYDCGTGDGTPPAFEYATYNASFTPAVNTCTKTGYNFSGWMVSRDPNDIKPESIAFTWTYTEDKRFSALWTPQTSTVTLNSNGGTAGSVTSVTATYDAAMPTISGNGALPTRPGYTFDGYGDDATTTGGIKYYNADGTSAHTWDKTGNQILYAIWRANCNAVTINVAANGGTINGDSESLVLYKHSGSGTPWVTHENCHNRNRITSLTQFGDGGLPEKTNASYTGVFENQGIPTGAQPIAIDGALDDSWEISGPTTIYAHYDCDEHWQGNGVDISGACDSGTQYNIYYVMNGGTNYAGAPTSYTYGTGATINGTPTREHSGFIEWCTDSALTDCGSYQEISTTDYGDKTYYVKWKCLEGYSANNDGSACVANTITLNWNENGGSAVANGSCTYNGDLILPAAPSRTGYTFVEWVLYDGTAKSAGTTVDNGCVYEKTGVYEGTSTSITARWSPNTYTIAYAGMTGATHGNNHPTSATYDEGVEVSAPSKPGYTFAGWNISGMDTTTHYHGTTSANTAFNTTTLNGTMSTKFKNLRASSGTVTFTATWSTDVYTITLSDGTGTSQSGMPNPIYLKYNTGWYSNSAATTGIGTLAATPIKIGYLFEGYYTNSDGTGTQIINNAGTIVANNTAFVANATIYAKYTAQTGFTVTTTNLAANTTFKFAISAAGQFYVDWGDGTVTSLNRENNTTETPVLHTYTTAGVKTITIYGRATGYNAGNSVAVIRFGADANAAVAGVTNTLVSGVSGSLATVFPTISGTQPKFVRTFGTCTNLTGAIPVGLFSGLSGAPVADMFLGTFEMDAGLTGTIPAGLFSAVSGAVQTGTFKDTFKGCTNLTGYVPRGLFATFSGGNVANTHTDMFVDSGLASECPCGMTQYTTGFENTDGKINTKVSCQLGTKIGEYWHNGHCVTECESGITRLRTSNGVDVPLLRAKVGIKNVAFKHNNEVCYSPVETGNLSGHVNLKQGATTYHISEPDGIEPDGFRNLPDGVLPASGYTVE